jgi:hypothetical protein
MLSGVIGDAEFSSSGIAFLPTAAASHRTLCSSTVVG